MTLEQCMIPIWNTDIIFGESLCMVQDGNGEACARLLFDPKDILSVTNAAETISYEKDRDWYMKDGWFCLTPKSRIFSFSQEQLYPEKEIPKQTFPTVYGFLRFEEGHFFHDRQIAISYTCKKDGWKGVRPAYVGAKLPKTIQKLKTGGPLNVLIFGDSISEGANASGMIGTPPYQPPYFELFIQELSKRMHCPVSLENVSMGGMDSAWGAENAGRFVDSKDFDLVVVAFGMNDSDRTPEQFGKNIRKIIDTIAKIKPETEFILIATSTPNPILKNPKAMFYGNQPLFKAELDQIEEEYAEKGGVAVADITGMQSFLHSRKRFIDTTGNNVNHPNDFFHRCYAQFLVGMLLKC